MIALEICVQDLAGVAAARVGGADRIELCAALSVGGITPARSLVEAAVGGGLPVHVLIREGAGDFVVDDAAVRNVAREIAAVGAIGAAGVVVGALTAANELDQAAMACWRRAAGAMTLTLHRAVDLSVSPVATVSQAIDLGIDRILTSGGAVSAVAGAPVIADMVATAAGRIEIMAGAGVTPDNAAALLAATGAHALHASASVAEPWADPRIARFGFAADRRKRTSVAQVRLIREAIAAWSKRRDHTNEIP